MTRAYDIREVAKLYRKGLSYTEIGKHLGLSKGQVAGAIRDVRGEANAHRLGKELNPVKHKQAYKDRFKTVKPAPHAHPLVRRLIVEMNAQRCSWETLHTKAGVGRANFKAWRSRVNPSLTVLEACYNVLGLTLQPVELEDGDQ